MIKKLLFPAIVGLSMAFASCTSDPCKDLDGKCGTGTCFEGACVCDEGYEADAAGICNFEWSAKFLGDYLGSENCTSNNPVYSGTYNVKPTLPCKISRVSETQVKVLNLGGFESVFNATIKKENNSDVTALVIEFTNALDQAGDTWSGSFIYSPTDNTLKGAYNLKITSGTTGDYLDCTINYNK